MPDGDAFIAYVGLADHPRAGALIEEINEAIAEAAFARLAELSEGDPIIRAMTHPEYRLWETFSVPLEAVRTGMIVRPPARPYLEHPVPEIEGRWRVVKVANWGVVVEGMRLSGRPVQETISPERWKNALCFRPLPLDAAALAAEPYAGER